MTESEHLLETCIHEAAHFAFATWANGKIHEISIGERDCEGFISGGHTSWSMTEDMSSDRLAAVFAAGKAIDTLRARLTPFEIETGASADKAGFTSFWVESLGETEEFQADAQFKLGFDTAIYNLADPKNRMLVECLGNAISRRCIDGKVSIRGHDIQELFDECQSS